MTRLEGAPLDPASEPVVEIPPAPASTPAAPTRSYIKCDCCGCSLTASGEVFKMGAQAKDWRDADVTHAREVETLNATITKLRADLAAATAPKKKGFFD